jgi:hypothetical protein
MNSKSLLAVMIDAISAGLFVLGAALIAVAILLFTVRTSVTTITFWRFFPQLCRWSQTWPPIRVHGDSVILILETQAGGRRSKRRRRKPMSRHFAAYFAIVGTLAFAPGGAVNAGPFNMPHFTMLRPQPHFNMLRPQISMPPLHLSNMPPPHLTNQKFLRDAALPRPTGQSVNNKMSIPSLGGAGTQSSSSGNASAMLVSNTGGSSLSANPGGGPPTSRFRVIEDGGRFAVVDRRSDTVIKAGFESYKAAQAWIANHV